MAESIVKSSEGGRAGHALVTGQQQMSEAEFNELRSIIHDMTGISMGSSKRLLVQRRISGRLKATNMPNFGAYIEHLKTAGATELEAFSNAVTTNLTSFFRERHHFEFLVETFLPQLAASKVLGKKKLRIWSAGCSTGEEPYSIAMTVQESLPNLRQWDVKILATDLDSDVLSRCRAGVYPQRNMENMSLDRLRRWFSKSADRDGDVYTVGRDLRELIVFNQLNLMRPWPMRGSFDLIFCRNVVIYFDKPTQRVLMDRYADILEDDGYLIIGHSESLNTVSTRFDLIGKTIYRRNA